MCGTLVVSLWLKSLMRNASNTHFLTLFLALTHLLDKINVCPTILWGFNFQSIDPS